VSPPMARNETKDVTTELLAVLAPAMLESEALWGVMREVSPDEIDVAFRWVGQSLSDIIHGEGPHHV